MSSIDVQPSNAAPSADTPQPERYRGFQRGNQAYKGRLKRVEGVIERLRATYDVSSPGDWALVSVIAHNLADAETARSRIARTRSTNSAIRLLRQLKRKPEKPVTIDDLIIGGRR